MDININITSRVLEKLLALCGHAGTGFLLPYQIKRRAAADAAADKIKHTEAAKTDIQVKEIQILGQAKLEKLKEEQLALIDQRDIPRDSSAFLMEAQKDRDRRLIEAEFNLAQIIRLVLEELASIPDGEVSDAAVDQDWFTQFRDKAEKVSDENMQQLWAKVLAGEVKEPGTTSLHAIDFLSKMSKQDAQLIEKLCPFAIFSEGILFEEEEWSELANLWDINELTILDNTRLYDLGIIGSLGAAQSIRNKTAVKKMELRYENKNQEFFCCLFAEFFDRALYLFVGFSECKELSFGLYRITQLGREILRLASPSNSSVYLDFFAALMAKKGFDYFVKIPAEQVTEEGVLSEDIMKALAQKYPEFS